MTEKKLNIVSFDNPFPPNYGGVIDVFYKIKNLHLAGVKIILHCFCYGRKPNIKVEKYCEKVYYYKRKKKIFDIIFSKIPFIIKSRANKKLLLNLTKNKAPILFEGLHTCYFLNNKLLKDRKKIVRLHNVEWKYYKALAINEKNKFKKFYFNFESKKLKQFESNLKHSNYLFTISNYEQKYYESKFNNTTLLPAFHQFNKVEIDLEKSENFALYFGNLSVSENEKAALFLTAKVFKNFDGIKLIIAGRNASEKLKNEIAKNNFVSLIENPTDEILQKNIKKAKVVLLPTFQNTGLKLKLINALFNAKHLIINQKMLANTALKNIVEMANTKEEWQLKILNLIEKKFTTKNLEQRNLFCEKYFNNENSTQIILNNI